MLLLRSRMNIAYYAIISHRWAFGPCLLIAFLQEGRPFAWSFLHNWCISMTTMIASHQFASTIRSWFWIQAFEPNLGWKVKWISTLAVNFIIWWMHALQIPRSLRIWPHWRCCNWCAFCPKIWLSSASRESKSNILLLVVMPFHYGRECVPGWSYQNWVFEYSCEYDWIWCVCILVSYSLGGRFDGKEYAALNHYCIESHRRLRWLSVRWLSWPHKASRWSHLQHRAQDIGDEETEWPVMATMVTRQQMCWRVAKHVTHGCHWMMRHKPCSGPFDAVLNIDTKNAIWGSASLTLCKRQTIRSGCEILGIHLPDVC